MLRPRSEFIGDRPQRSAAKDRERSACRENPRRPYQLLIDRVTVSPVRDLEGSTLQDLAN